jgi:probable rRNA maturation factor
MKVSVFDETGALTPGLYEIIENTAAMAGEYENLVPGFSVDIMVTDEVSMRTINREKRKIDKVTDVLSFPMVNGAVNKERPQFLGDIVICLNVLYSQAEAYGHSTEREAGFLTAHGMLHLIGYDHEDETDSKLMFEKQEGILDRLGLKR